jgi:hypothetical protein
MLAIYACIIIFDFDCLKNLMLIFTTLFFYPLDNSLVNLYCNTAFPTHLRERITYHGLTSIRPTPIFITWFMSAWRCPHVQFSIAARVFAMQTMERDSRNDRKYDRSNVLHQTNLSASPDTCDFPETLLASCCGIVRIRCAVCRCGVASHSPAC